MNTMLKGTTSSLWKAIVLALAFAAPAIAGPESYTHSGVNSWAAYKYIDLGSRVPASRGDWQYHAYVFEPNQPALRSAVFTLTNSSTTEGVCFEFVLAPPDNHPTDTGVSYTTTYVYDLEHDVYKKTVFIEDFIGGARQSTKRVYIRNGQLDLYVAAISDPQFGVWIKQTNLTESQCVAVQGNQTWIKVIDYTYTWGPYFQ